MTASLLPSLLAFIAVIAMIPLALWLMKRGQALRPRASGPLTLVAGLSMGPRERIAVVQAGGRYLVVGVTAQSINVLSTLDDWPGAKQDPAAGEAAQTPAGSLFARVLRTVDRRDGHDPHR
jgi:flagellar protein FliO/FliZ